MAFGRGFFDYSPFGRDHQIRRVRIKGIGNQTFIPTGTVGASSIDEIHADIDGAPQKTLPALPVCVRTEITGLTGKPHGSIAKTSHLPVVP
jgi:hypothetical protein